MKLTEYLDRARERAGIPSDTRLAAAIGVHQTAIVSYRRGTATPTPARMVRLAELAGVDPAAALLHRAAWQADDAASRDVMSRILASWMEAPAANPLTAPKSLGAAAAIGADNCGRLRYIMEIARLWVSRWIRHLIFPPISRDTSSPAEHCTFFTVPA
jgi:transcriptional regulator with XRE-family HTH domain